MAATATSKPKAPRTIVSTKVTASGIETKLAKWAEDQLTNALDRCNDIGKIPRCAAEAKEAYEAVSRLIVKAQSTPTNSVPKNPLEAT